MLRAARQKSRSQSKHRWERRNVANMVITDATVEVN